MTCFSGKTALVTGGGSGIGRAICQKLAGEGAAVIVASIVATEAEAVAADTGGTARLLDVTDASAVEALAAEFPNIDILVTCAGVMGARKPILETSADAWRLTHAVNLDGTFYCIKAVLPGMIARDWGRIITLSSASGKQPAALNSDYASSKHGVIGLTKTVAIELGMMRKNGITANALCPGPINTPMMDAIVDQLAPAANMEEEKFRKVNVAKNIQRRLLDAEEVANMAAYLASDEASAMTGQAINVCGGIVLH